MCVEDARSSQHTTESIYYTPWSYPCICFDLLIRLWKFRMSKTKRRNAFQYVVLRPSAPSSSKDIIAATSGKQGTKVQILFVILPPKEKKCEKVWKIREKYLSLQRQTGEFAERMTARLCRLQGKNLYGLQRSFRAPNITSHHSDE